MINRKLISAINTKKIIIGGVIKAKHAVVSLPQSILGSVVGWSDFY